jgi:hypothetical protein
MDTRYNYFYYYSKRMTMVSRKHALEHPLPLWIRAYDHSMIKLEQGLIPLKRRSAVFLPVCGTQLEQSGSYCKFRIIQEFRIQG